jgi:hypothetical protein
MSDLTASRTLVKSPPELWNEVSEVEALARHLGELGEIKITRVDPEHTVAWEGERARGTVSLEPSGWGTTVTFTATVPRTEEPEPPPEPEPEPPPAADRPDRPRLLGRLFPGFWLPEPEPALEPVRQPEPPPEPEPVAAEPPPGEDEVRAVLDGALDALGAAHHRPFSRG